jgi:hypothetical protein
MVLDQLKAQRDALNAAIGSIEAIHGELLKSFCGVAVEG